MASTAIYYSPSKSSKYLEDCDMIPSRLTRPWPMSQPVHFQNNSNGTGPRRNVTLTGSQRPKLPRPMSMPSSHHLHAHVSALVTLNSYCLDAEGITPVEHLPEHRISPDPQVIIPSRQLSGMNSVPTPTPTCVPWISNVKAIKRLQSKIGLGDQEKVPEELNLSPLRFHSVHGENIQVFQGGLSVRRVPSVSHSYCKAIVFSDRPVRVNERVCVKVIGSSTEFAGGIRFGLTNQDPSTLRYSLPDRAIPELAKRQGFWAKALLGDNVLKNEAILFYYVNNSGKVRYGINGKKVGTFLKYVDTRRPLWALLDVYGNTTAIELVDPKAHLNNSRKSLDEGNNQTFDEVDSAIGPSMNSLNLTASDLQINPATKSAQTLEPELAFNNIQIHPTCGRNVQLNKLRNVAWRNSNEPGNAYIFTSRPVTTGETILVQVLQSDCSLEGSLAFGLTATDPDSINPKTLPDDSYFLVDRPEYWIFKKNAVRNLQEGDELAITLTSGGAVHISKNRGPPMALMYVDMSAPLYAFFDLYGSTHKISVLGSIHHSPKPEMIRTPGGSRSLRNVVHVQSPSVPTTGDVPASLNFTSSPSRVSIKGSPQIRNGEHKFQPGRSLSTSPSKLNEACGDSCKHAQVQAKFMKRMSEASLSVGQSNLKEKEAISSSPYTECKTKVTHGGESKNWSVDCVACCRRPVNSLFSPCGHLTMCYECAYEYWKARPHTACPICRKQISNVIPISKPS